MLLKWIQIFPGQKITNYGDDLIQNKEVRNANEASGQDIFAH